MICLCIISHLFEADLSRHFVSLSPKATSPNEKRVEKQESSRHRQTRNKRYIFVELKREKAFPLGGKNYKQKKLNWEEGGGAADG